MALYNSSDTMLSLGQAAIEEVLGTCAALQFKSGSSVFRNAILEPASELAAAEIGRDYNYIREYYVKGLSGVVQGMPRQNYVSLEGEAADAFASNRFQRTNISGGVNSALHQWPDPAASPRPKPFQLGIRVGGQLFNDWFSLTEMRLDKLPANKLPYVATRVGGVARHAAKWLESNFWANQSQYNRLGTLGTSPGTSSTSNPIIDTTNKRITFQPTEGTVKRFEVGAQVDFYAGASSPYDARLNESPGGIRVACIVVAIDEFTREVVVEADPSNLTQDGTVTMAFTAWATNAALSGAYVCWADQPNRLASRNEAFRIRGIAGWRDWVKYGGSTTATKTLLGDPAALTSFGITGKTIDVTVHREFKSGYFQNVGVLTYTKLLQHLATVERQFDRLDYSIDKLMAADGVWLQYMTQFENRLRFDSPLGGAPVTGIFKDGRPGITSESGRFYEFETVGDLEQGVILGLKTENNWTVITPPEPDNTTYSGNREGVPSKLPLKMLVPALTGGQMQMWPYLINNGNGMTEFKQMPLYMHIQLMPKNQIPGVLWDGVTDLRTNATQV